MSFVALFCATAVALINTQASHKGSEGLLMENIEALSQGEGGTPDMCTFAKVSIDESKHKIECSGKGHQCCIMN